MSSEYFIRDIIPVIAELCSPPPTINAIIVSTVPLEFAHRCLPGLRNALAF
jgi:hypothetical protein